LTLIFELAAILACAAAGVLLLCAVRRPFGEQPILRVARRIGAVAMFSATAYMVYELVEYGSVHTVYCWLLGLFGLSQLLFSMHTFMEPHCATRLIVRKPCEAPHA
jgi:hypothetical protein